MAGVHAPTCPEADVAVVAGHAPSRKGMQGRSTAAAPPRTLIRSQKTVKRVPYEAPSRALSPGGSHGTWARTSTRGGCERPGHGSPCGPVAVARCEALLGGCVHARGTLANRPNEPRWSTCLCWSPTLGPASGSPDGQLTGGVLGSRWAATNPAGSCPTAVTVFTSCGAACRSGPTCPLPGRTTTAPAGSRAAAAPPRRACTAGRPRLPPGPWEPGRRSGQGPGRAG
jgi:hypothetical protein